MPFKNWPSNTWSMLVYTVCMDICVYAVRYTYMSMYASIHCRYSGVRIR